MTGSADAGRYATLRDAFARCVEKFEKEYVIDTYILCLTRHDENIREDDLLSMWRGYGGSGGGAAIVFNAAKIDELPSSPFIVSYVTYGSGEARRRWIQNKIGEFCDLLRAMPLTIAQLPFAAHVLFERFKLFALYTKHHGFSEEREWRITYMPERDPRGALTPMLG